MKSGRKRQRSSDKISNPNVAKKRLNALIAAADSIESAESPAIDELTQSINKWSAANWPRIWSDGTIERHEPGIKLEVSFKITPALRP